MARKTTRWGFQVLEGDDVSTDGSAFTVRDRDLMDRLHTIGVEEHRHTGLEAGTTVLDAPELVLDTDAGGIPAGVRVRYRYSLVDENDLETGASAEAFIDTPEPVDPPPAPGLDTADTGGTHIPGLYFYVLSAYQDFSTNESLTENRNQILVPVGTNTNTITLDLPSLPDGATGFNVYRRAPGSTKYFFLDSIDMEVATPPSSYVDDDLVDEDCDRSLPIENTTFSTNSVVVSLPGVDPEVPEGSTWKLYRSFIADDWGSTLLHWVVEETEEDSGIITPTYTDVGEAADSGSPSDTGQEHGTPPKVTLTDTAEVKGILPVARNVIPHEVMFGEAGALTELEGNFQWVCPFEFARIKHVRANLGRNTPAVSQDVIIDVNALIEDTATPTWTSIYAFTDEQPTVAVGDTVGDIAPPTEITELVRGDRLAIDIDQADGEDLIVIVYMIVQSEVDGEGDPVPTEDLSEQFTQPDS